MEKAGVVATTLVVYQLLLVVIGIWANKRTRTDEDFFLGGRGLGPVVAALSYSASASSAYTLLGISGAAYLLGVSVIWIAGGSFTGMLVAWYWLGPRLRAHTRRKDQVTLTDFLLEDTAGSIRQWTSVAASAIIIFSFVFYVAAQFQGAGSTFASSFGWPVPASIALGAFIILVYMLLGGFWAVSVTDVVQGGLMSVAAVALPWVAVAEVGGFGEFLERLQAASTPQQLSWTAGNVGLAALGLVIGGLSIGFGTYGQPHLLVRFMALRDEKALRQARAITIAWYLAVFGGMCLLGLVGRVLHPSIDNPENILFALTDSVFTPFLGAILVTAVLSAIMSTADSQLLVAASAIAHDLGLGRGRALSSLLISRLTVLVLVVVAVAVAIYLPEGIFSRVLFAWAALGAAFGPTVFLRLAGVGLKPRGVLASILTGFSLAVVFYLLPNTPGDVLERLGPFCAALCVLMMFRERNGVP